ncbi:TIGR00341 family protein [uncultured Demequina sp.]|uniref:TIGR00341 family protein n=1 Tax=uncultured Demequina sp. TaxID=693499 RepID=UPI0025F4E866|nr:TIGR00341 family protein [uncultured Demequina sp.]
MSRWTSLVRETRWGAKLNTVDYLREAAFFEGPTVRSQHTRFWLLLILSSAIASAGVVANSTATVIGAMIVAPLMRPIQGTMIATVLGDRRNLIRSILIMVSGAVAAMAVGFLIGLIVIQEVTAQTNDQVAGRVSPGLVDLFAAFAVGAVGSIAIVRSDISDTLPGVAIAISLVPPLCVAGLALESGEPGQAFGAVLLFVTNVAAILATGSIVMAIYGFSRLRLLEAEDKEAERRRRVKAYITTAILVALVAGPLTYSTAQAIESRSREQAVRDFVEEATENARWKIISIQPREGDLIVVQLKGTPPIPDLEPVWAEMEDAGLDTAEIVVEFVPTYSFDVNGPRDSA